MTAERPALIERRYSLLPFGFLFYTDFALCVSPTHFDRFDSQSSFSRRMRGLPRPGTGTPVGSGVS